LRDAGVYVTLDEFKSRMPIVRAGMLVETRETDFNRPVRSNFAVVGSTSGSRLRETPVAYNWDFLAEEATEEALLFEIHGLMETPFALWFPRLPAMAGIHNLLMQIKYCKIPRKWFSQIEQDSRDMTFLQRAAVPYVRILSRLAGMSVPRPEYADFNYVGPVVDWIVKEKREHGRSALKTYTSSAMRIAQYAADHGVDISGTLIFTGGEPLTRRRAEFMKALGIQPYARYVATEAGIIGASCTEIRAADDMHIYTDRIALIQRRHKIAQTDHEVATFLLTALSRNTPKVLFNTELGDFGDVEVRPCGCLFGSMGMNLHVSGVRSYDKLTGEGMTLLGSELGEVVATLIEECKGSPDDFQFWEDEDSSGFTKVIVAVSSRVSLPGEQIFADRILARLRLRNEGSRMTSQMWEQAATLEVIRAHPVMTKRFKLLPLMKKSGQPGEKRP